MFCGRLCVKRTAAQVLPAIGPALFANRSAISSQTYATNKCTPSTNIQSLWRQLRRSGNVRNRYLNCARKKPCIKGGGVIESRNRQQLLVQLRVLLCHCHICEVINDTPSRRNAHGLPFVRML